MKTASFDETFHVSAADTKTCFWRGSHILRVRQLFNAHPRTFSVSLLWKISYFFRRPIIYSCGVFFFSFFIFFFFICILLDNNTLVCCFYFRTIKKYTLNLSSKNISQYCKSPPAAAVALLLWHCLQSTNAPLRPRSRDIVRLDIMYRQYIITLCCSMANVCGRILRS